MGYRIREYTLDELSRISVPGGVVPALFWALPVGKWDPFRLEEYWLWFTESDGLCRKLGLLLAKEGGSQGKSSQPSADSAQVDLTTAKLDDLLPYHPRRARRGPPFRRRTAERPRVVVFAGSYPQPGWGITVEPGRSPAELEDMIEEALSQLPAQRQDLLDQMDRSVALHYQITDLREQIAGYTPRQQRARHTIASLNEISDQVNSLQRTIDLGEWKDFPKAISRLIQEWTAKKQSLSQDLELISPDYRRDDMDLLERSLEEQGFYNKNNVSKSKLASKLLAGENHESPGVAGLIAAIDQAQERDTGDTYDREWAELTIGELTPAIQSVLEEMSASTRKWHGEISRMSNEYETLQHRRREAVGRYAPELQAVLSMVGQLGPHFLTRLETIAQKRGQQPKVAVWDYPRMIGWKLLALNAVTSSADVYAQAQELLSELLENTVTIPSSNVGGPTEDHTHVQADGSVMTDYVHFVVVNSPQHEARDVMQRLLAKLYGAQQLRDLGEVFGEQLTGIGTTELTDRVLTLLGWPSEATAETVKPLASLLYLSEDRDRMRSDFNGSRLRVSAENFCKDLVTVLTTELPRGLEGLESVLFTLDADPPRHDGVEVVIHERLATLKLGNAAHWLKAIVEVARSETDLPDRIFRAVRTVNNFTKPDVHDNAACDGVAKEEVREAIESMIEVSEQLVGEMPWHFSPRQTIGSHPKIYVGIGWSHSHVAERTLHILSFHRHPKDGGSILVWDSTGHNPVMPDPQFLDAVYPV